jgi:hypothetical protein
MLTAACTECGQPAVRWVEGRVPVCTVHDPDPHTDDRDAPAYCTCGELTTRCEVNPREYTYDLAAAASAAAASADWDCEAYGSEGTKIGARCFRTGDLGRRVCHTQDECHHVMVGERQRIFRRINELAADGDETAAYLAAEFAKPADMLNATEDE